MQAIGPFVSLIVPMCGPLTTITVVPMSQSCGPQPISQELTIPPVGAIMAGFILDKSAPA